jgi:hypothetical protein
VAVGGAVLRDSAGGCRNGLRRIAALPLGVRGPAPSRAFSQFAAICAALAVSLSFADRGPKAIPVDRQLSIGLFRRA